MVFELLASRPAEESVGVVALFRAQADLVESLIEERRLLNRSLDDRFSEDLDERFFLKDLENVQGARREADRLGTDAGGVSDRPVSAAPQGKQVQRLHPLGNCGVSFFGALAIMTLSSSACPSATESGRPRGRRQRRLRDAS